MLKLKIYLNKIFSESRLFRESGAGFTLFEVLVMVVIIGIMSGIGYADFDAMRNQLTLKRAAYQFSQDLRRVQEMALSNAPILNTTCIFPSDCGIIDAICQNGKCSLPNHGYGLYIDILPGPATKTILYADTANAKADQNDPTGWGYYNFNISAPTDYEQSDYTYKISGIEKGVIITGFKKYNDGNNLTTQKASVEFVPPNPDTEFFDLTSGIANNIAEGVQIVLALEADKTKTKCVSINRAGLITINDTCSGL